MKTDELLNEIEEVFPLVEKPKGIDLSFHKDDCFQCEALRKDLEKYEGNSLPEEGLRWIYDDMSCLSSKAWLWVMPFYLKYCLANESTYGSTETEFLIYNLGPEEKYKDETKQRLGLFKPKQIQCLIHFLEWCSANEHWSEYCPDEIDRAIKFLSKELA